MERNENCSLAQGPPASCHYCLSLVHHYTILRVNHHVSHCEKSLLTEIEVVPNREFLPRLVPVEVRESKAAIWFESLLDGIAHIHAHGIVHNDIKPANILLTRTEQPVLVDFGFAERYGTEKPILRPSPSVLASPSSSVSSLLPSFPKAPFESNLAYGTPEYLSPERAKGYIHDVSLSILHRN